MVQQSKWKPFMMSMSFFICALLVRTCFHWPMGETTREWIIFPKMGVIFGLLGAIYGIVYALDTRADSANINLPILRGGICAGIGGLLALILQVPSPFAVNFGSVALGAGVLGFLGWVGWTWAKRINF